MLPVLIEQIRDVTARRIHEPVPEPNRGPVRHTVAVVLQRAAHRLDPRLVAQPRPEAA